MGLRHRLAVLEQRLRSFGRRPRRAEPAAPRRKPLFEVLEQRLLLSADLIGIPTWVEQGPAPTTNGNNVIIPAANSPQVGAIEAIAPDPGIADRVFVATINGGVWRTTNATAANPTWIPLTDQFPSLSMGAIAFSPLDATNNTLYAGTGRYSNGFGDGGALTGLLLTTDGGNNWAPIGGNTFNNINVRNIVPTSINTATGQVVLVASDSGANGLFRSANGGNTFNVISGTSGAADGIDNDADGTTDEAGEVNLPSGGITSLVADPGNANRFYAAIPGQGVFRSDNGGQSWRQVNNGLTFAGSSRIVLSVHNNAGAGSNAVYAGVYITPPAPPPNTNWPSGLTVFRSGNQGANWAQVGTVPNVNPGGQAGSNLTILADRDNANVVFVSGDRGTLNNAGNIQRGDATTGTWTQVVNAGANNTAPHPDSRAMAFDANGDILESDDGGIYRLDNPNLDQFFTLPPPLPPIPIPVARIWQSVNGDIRPSELYSVAWDAFNDRLFGGTQDNGSPNQTATGSLTWRDALGGDGANVQVALRDTNNDGTFDQSIRYMSRQNFGGFLRVTIDAGNPGGVNANPALTVTGAGGSNIYNVERMVAGGSTIQFVQPYATNAVDPNRLIVGTNFLYESTDQGATLTSLGGLQNLNADGINNDGDGATDEGDEFRPTNPVGAVNPSAFGTLSYSPIAYGGVSGGVANPAVLWVGAGGGLLLRTAGAGAPTAVVTYTGGTVLDIALDPNDWQTAFVLDNGGRVWRTTDAGATAGNWTNVTGNLNTFTNNLRTIAVVETATDQVVLVGGLQGVYRTVNPGATPAWNEFGTGLPNALVHDLRYDATDDVLVVGTWGRGAWTIPNASTSVAADALLRVTGDMDFPNEADTVELRRRAANPLLLDVFVNGALARSVEFSILDRIEVNTLGNDDLLIANLVNGDVIPTDGIDYDGGVDDDELDIRNGTFGTVTYTATGPIDGSVALGANDVIRYDFVQQVTDGTSATNRVFTAAGTGGQTIRLVDDGGFLGFFNGFTRIDSGSAVEFAVHDFANPSASLTINAGAGNDNVQLLGTDFFFNATVTINADDGNDDVLIATAPTTTNVNGGSGDDDITVNFGSLTGLVTVNGGPDVDTLLVNGTPFADVLVVTPATITRGAETIAFSEIETVTLAAGDGDDDIMVNGSGPFTLILDGQEGSDDYVLEIGGITGLVIINDTGTAGVDTLLLNGTPFDDTIVLTDILITFSGGSVLYFGIETLTVDAKAGNDLVDGSALTRAITIIGGEGNDTLLSGSGADTLIGGPGNDHMEGGDGGDKYIFAGLLLGIDTIFELKADTGIDVLDFSMFGAAIVLDLRRHDAQVVSPGNLTLTLEECEAIEDVIGSPFGNTLHGNSGPNHLVGGGAVDVLHGEGGDDFLEGLGGDDELYGEEGADKLEGGTGDDVLLGDRGIVTTVVDATGTHKEVLLVDQAVIVGNRAINASKPFDAGLMDDELLMLVGAKDAKGRFETRLLSLDLLDAGDDTLLGGDGADLMFGQRGKDLLDGAAGDDYIEGNEGDDKAHGGGGDDVLIGDNSYHFLPTEDHLPTVAHGYEIVDGPPEPCEVPAPGPTLVPLAALTPHGVHSIEPFGAALYEGARNLAVLPTLAPLTDASGRTLYPFASIIPDVPRHRDLIAGNDELFGDAGADRLIGDHSAILAPFQSGLAGMLCDLEHAMERLALAERILPPHPVVVPAVASDILHGGDDDDVLVGDMSLTLVGTAATTGALPAGLEQAADDFDDGVTAFVAKLKGKPTPIGFTTSQDQLFGESGDDRLVGDHTVTVAVAIDGPAGSTVKTDWLAKVKLPSLTVGGAKDMLDGGIGDDELVGDSDVAVIAGVGVSPFDDIADAALPAAGELGSEQLAISGNHTQRVAPLLPAVQVGSGTGTGYHTIATGRVVDTLTVRGAQDLLTGGSGDDLEVGDGRVQVAAYVQGPFATLDPGVKHPDRQLVRIGSLVGTVGLEGSEDRLAGNDGDDTLIGDAAATIAGVFSGPALLIGAGQAIARPKVTQHDEELVHFTGLVDLLRAQGAFDVLEGGGGDDALVGDHQVLVSGVVAGRVLEGLPAATGFTSDHRFETAVEFSELLGTLDLCGGGDSLFGGDGDDELLGDSATVIAGILREGMLAGPAAFVAQAAFQHPYREALVDFDGLVGCISSSGSPDELYGGDGDDALAGDDQLVVAGVIHGDLVVAGPGTAALPAKKTQDTALVEFDGLLGSAELCGAMDWLFGGEGDDLAAGDHRLLVLGMQDGAVVQAGAALAGAIAAAQGRLSGEAQVDFDHFVDCIVLRGADDTIGGEAGDDHLLGDHLATVKALVVGPLLAATVPGTGLPSAPACGEWLVEFEGFVGSLELRGGADALAGGDGEDRLTGDSATEVAAVIDGTLHDGFGGTALPGPVAPAELHLLRFEPLVGSIADYGGKDTLAGGRDADELNGDSALGIHQVIASDGATPPLFPPLFAHVRTEGLVDKATLYGERDQLTGEDGDDCLVGDHVVHVATVLEGEQPGDAVRITVAKLANSLALKGADDRLDGAAGDDHLAGDSDIAVTGLALPDGASLGNRVIEIESALGNLRAEGGCDTLTGGDGEDIMLGDNAAVLTGVAFSGGFAPAVGAVRLVEVGTLVCDVDLVGSRDTLDGGRDGDTLYGGNHLTLAAASGDLDAGTALRVEVGKIAPSIDVTDGQDKLTGGDGGDRLFGDNRIEAAAFAGTVAAGAGIDVEVHGMVDCLLVKGGDDQAWGNAGDDLLVGDNQLVVAGMVLTAAIDGEVEVDIDGGFGRITLEGGCDSLDGGDGADTLIGDHLAAIGAVLDPESRPASAGATGEAEIDVESLIERLELKSGDDKLYGGAGGDLLLGDSDATVAAFLGAFATPIAMSVDASGARLVGEMDVRAGCDTLRGGIGDDVLVGDNDVLVALAAGGAAGPAGSYAVTKLIEKLTVAAGSDNLNGEAGTNVLEHGNRVTAPPSLVKKSSLSSVSKTLAPAAPPVIDWLGGLCGTDAAAPAGGRGWRAAFVTALGQTASEQNPNLSMRVVL